MKEIVLLLLLTTLLSSCSRFLIFHPDQEDYLDLAPIENEVQKTFIKSKSGNSLSVWKIIPKGEAVGTILHFHGNAQNNSAHIHSINWLVDRGYKVYMLDYSGYGSSDGSATLNNFKLDALSFVDYFSREVDNCIMYGQSLGGYGVAYVLSERSNVKCSTIILESSFDSFHKLVDDKASNSVVKFIGKVILESGTLEANYNSKKVIVLVNKKDHVIPFKTTMEMYGRISSKQKDVIISDTYAHSRISYRNKEVLIKKLKK